MNRVSIFSTNKNAAHFESFIHEGIEYRFSLLTCEGPMQIVEGRPIVFIGWLLENCSGLELVRRLRADERMAEAHITMVLDEDNEEDRRRALKAGADDYALAPLDRQALLDRAMVLRAGTSTITSDRVVELGDLAINLAGEQARWQERLIPLSPNDLRLLRFLAENPNRVFAREELIGAIGKNGDPDQLRTVDVWIKRLRFGLRKVGAGHLLRTVHGKGYVLDSL